MTARLEGVNGFNFTPREGKKQPQLVASWLPLRWQLLYQRQAALVYADVAAFFQVAQNFADHLAGSASALGEVGVGGAGGDGARAAGIGRLGQGIEGGGQAAIGIEQGEVAYGDGGGAGAANDFGDEFKGQLG
jgi:hypothetical protein